MSSYGVWLSAAGMKMCEHRQKLHANNLANAQTTGFKSDLASFQERPVEAVEGGVPSRLRHSVLDRLSGGVNVRRSHYDLTQGSLEITGRPLDVAIRGEGYFTVSDGTTKRLTRDGEFALNTAGELILADASGNWRVLDQAGAPVRVDPAAGELRIGSSGAIQQGTQTVAQIGIVSPTDAQALRKVGANLFEMPAEELKPAAGSLVAGAREESNYDTMTGLTEMIEASRAFQMNATLLQLQDAATGEMVTLLGRVA